MTTFMVANVVPHSHSNEDNQDAEPSIAVNPANPQQILISAFTPSDSGQSNGPLYVSQDGGATWSLAFIVPGGEPLDQTYVFGASSGEFYAGDISGTSDTFSGTIILNALSTANPFVPGTMTILESPEPTDQPYIAATTVRFGPDTGKDRFYIGYNDQRATGPAGTGDTSAIDFCLDATASTPTIQTAHLDTRTTATWYSTSDPPGFNQDGPQVRTAVHGDGTIYAVFNGVRGFTDNDDGTGNTTSDVVVVRDDDWAAGPSPFTALVDPGDGNAGLRVQTGVALLWNPQGATLGQERAFGTFSIAVHPGNSDIVWLAWAGIESGAQTLHVQRSTNRGVDWSGSLLSIANATNAALAISISGTVGLMYQRLTGTAPNDRWETHFQSTLNGTTWTDATVCSTPAETPAANGLPYLGDYLEMVSVGKNFYGTFCANNTPDPTNFPATPATAATPNGASFQRNVTTSAPWELLPLSGTTPVIVSIDPFLLVVQEVATGSDFYVRDWTTSPTSADDGAQPSTAWDFWGSSDVWNQNSSDVAFAPDPDDVPHTENALAGADNYGFARVRRNELPAAGSGPTTVTAHFLVSEFGTGSNFVDNVYSDPSDPDVTFPDSDVTVSFADTELGPKDTPPTTWQLASTSSDHLCLAVEIRTPDDPFAPPGLTGQAPGQPGTTLSVIDDNNKAQRNLQVTPAAAGSGGIRHFGIVHNAGTESRDMILQLAPPVSGRPPKDTLVEVITDKGVVQRVTWQPWAPITLLSLQPGENRWIGITVPVPTGAAPVVTVTELKGQRPVNGFTLGSASAPMSTVIGWILGYHGRVLNRLRSGFAAAAADQGLTALNGLLAGKKGGYGAGDDDGADVDFDERVTVEERGLRIEVDVRVRRGDGRHRRGAGKSGSTTPDSSTYVKFARDATAVLAECLAALGGSDAFGISAALADLEAAEDPVAVTAAHATALNCFDAYMTMLQKARGDRADIRQMAQWHLDLSRRSAALAGLPETPGVVTALEAFIAQVDDGSATLSAYGALLAGSGPSLLGIAAALAAGPALAPLIGALTAASGARAMQKAHRSLLLALEQYA